MNGSTLPDPAQIQQVLPFIHDLEKQRDWIDRTYAPLLQLREPLVVSRLRKALAQHRVVLEDFDWSGWDDAHEIAGDFRVIASADLELLCRIVTAHVQADQFVRGHLQDVCRNGVMWAILRRLEQLVDEPGANEVAH